MLYMSLNEFHGLQHAKEKKILSEQILSIRILNPCKGIDVGCFAVVVLGRAVIRNMGVRGNSAVGIL